MKYFLDTEFLEGTQKKWFGETKPTIDLISIGIVGEDSREYYAISKDFNLKEAWNRYDIKVEQVSGDLRNRYPEGIKTKVYWLRDNVLKPIFIELRAKEVEEYNIAKRRNIILDFPTYSFSYKNFKRLINKYGKTNKQIAEEVYEFCKGKINERKDGFREFVYSKDDVNKEKPLPAYGYFENRSNPEFYGYYCDYDWVVFCWLFGKMIDLPKGFPMFAFDLKQTLDEKALNWKGNLQQTLQIYCDDFDSKLDAIKSCKDYPKQTNEHNALSDAHFNYNLYKFLNTL